MAEGAEGPADDGPAGDPPASAAPAGSVGGAWHRDEPWMAVVLVLAAVLHLLAVLGQQAFVYTDSVDYETLDLTGAARRPWVTPLLYWLADAPGVRILLQALISIACWQTLALVASSLAHRRAARWAIALATLGLSLTTTVTSWDTAMLSESLAISFSVLLLAALVRVWQARTWAAVGLALGAWVLWVFTRQNHLVMGWIVIVAVAVVVAVHGRRTRALHRPLALLLGGMVVVGVLGVASYSRNTEVVHHNLALVIGNRILPDRERADWFLEQGMPRPEELPIGLAAPPQALLADDAIRAWVETDGVRTYARYLLQHPGYALAAPLESFVSDRPPFGQLARGDDVMLASPDSYGVGRQVLPGPVVDLLFEPGQAGAVVFALGAAAALTTVRWGQRGPDRRWLVPLTTLVVQWPALLVVWHASTAELGRLALPSALLVRLALVVQLGLLLDAWLDDRHDRELDPVHR